MTCTWSRHLFPSYLQFAHTHTYSHRVWALHWTMLFKRVCEGGVCISCYKWLTTQLVSQFTTRTESKGRQRSETSSCTINTWYSAPYEKLWCALRGHTTAFKHISNICTRSDSKLTCKPSETAINTFMRFSPGKAHARVFQCCGRVEILSGGCQHQCYTFAVGHFQSVAFTPEGQTDRDILADLETQM